MHMQNPVRRKPLRHVKQQTGNELRGLRTGGWSLERAARPRGRGPGRGPPAQPAPRGYMDIYSISSPNFRRCTYSRCIVFPLFRFRVSQSQTPCVRCAWMDLLNYTIIHVPNATTREYRTSELPEECERQSVTACVASPARAGARAVGRPSPLRATRSRRRPGTPALQHLFVVGHRHRRGEHAIRAAYSQQEV